MDFHDIIQFFIHTAHAATQAATEAAPHAADVVSEVTQAATEAATHTEDPGIIGTLGINWKLFIAQLINFGIVLLVLWKWVLTPVAKKLTERTEKIEKAMSDADRITREKQEFDVWKTEEMNKARKEASSIITIAQTEATKAKEQIVIQTKEEQNRLIDQAKQQIQDEKDHALKTAKAELANIITNATEKIIRQKLDDKKDAELIKETLKNI